MPHEQDAVDDPLSRKIPLIAKPYEIDAKASSCYLIREMPEEEKPREKMQKYGNEALSNAELLALE